MTVREFDGLAVVVTGAASGIGAETARLLAGRGARIACLDRVATPALPSLIAYLASPLAGATTGTVPAGDGGMQHLRLPPTPSHP